MGTVIRPETAKTNKYWMPKHRYYELKHFCLQYLEWKKTYSMLDGYDSCGYENTYRTNEPSNPTHNYTEKRLAYLDKIRLIERLAFDSDEELASYILKAVTEGLSYTYLKSKLEIPCSRDTYYDRYRRFFWLLDKTRN